MWRCHRNELIAPRASIWLICRRAGEFSDNPETLIIFFKTLCRWNSANFIIATIFRATPFGVIAARAHGLIFSHFYDLCDILPG
jgi:hypothetical protein